MRWIVRIIGAVIVTVVVAAVALLLLPGEKIARIAADQVKARTGRSLDISGDVSMTLWPVLGVKTGPVALGNAEWAGDEPMLTARGLAIGVAAPDLLRREIRVTEIVVQDPVLRLQSRPDGRGNWEFGTEGAAAAEPAPGGGTGADAAGAATPITLEKLELSNATLIYQAAGEAPVSIANADVSLRWPDPAGAADIKATLRPAGKPVEIAARVDQFAAFLEGAVAPVTAKVNLPGAVGGFEGRATMTGEAGGRLTVMSDDTGAALEALGAGRQSVPAGLGQAGSLNADVTYMSDGRLSLRDMAIGLDQNRINGAVDVTMNGVPQITAQLTTGILDLAGATAGGGGGGGSTGAGNAPGTSADGWSRTPIDASALGLVNASVSLVADGIRTSDLTLGPSQLQFTLDGARAVLDIARISAFSGVISGQLVANNRNGLSVGGRLNASNIEILEMQRDLLGFERIKGQAGAEIEFLGAGNSVDAIMRSLSGKGGLQMGRGVILGFDLDKLMRSGESSGGTTVFDSLTASYVMKAGDLFNQDLLLKLTNFKADGAGRIGLGARDIDYVFTPVALRANSGEGLAVAVRIQGPWGAPRIRPDLEALAKAKADEKLKELEAEAKDKLQQKLEKELDVKVQDGQSSEEVLKDKLEDEAKNQLLKLLGKN